MHIQKVSLSHNILRLILVRIERDHKDGKALPHNAVIFLDLELKTTS